MLRKTALAVGTLLAAVTLGVFTMGTAAPAQPAQSAEALGPIGSGIEPTVVIPLNVAETSTLPAAPQPDVTSVPKLDTSVPVEQKPLDAGFDGAVPVPTNENGDPMYLSQDGGDGEHASIAVSQGVRDLIQSGDYNGWGLEFGESNLSDEAQTVFWLKSGDTYFRVTVAPDPTIAPE